MSPEYAKHFPFFKNNLLHSYPPLYCAVPGVNWLLRMAVRIAIRIKFLPVADLMVDHSWIYFDENKPGGPHFHAVEQLKKRNICAATMWRFRAKQLTQAHSEFVRALLKPSSDVLALGQKHLSQLNCEIRVGLHIRLGDLRQAAPDRVHDPEVYRTRMREIQALANGQRVGFVVCCEENLTTQFQEFQCVFPNGDPVEDLFALAQCDYLIGVLSTFSRWAAFWGNKPIFRIESPQQKVQSWSDFKQASFTS